MSRRESVRTQRVHTGLGPVNLLHARYVNQVFAPHFHQGYCIGVIEAGGLAFRYMGETVVAPAGAVNLAVPGEVHTGQAVDANGWAYRMFYLDADLLAHAAEQLAGKPASLPFIREGVLFDADLAGMIHRLHSCMQDRQADTLEMETGLLAVLTRVIRQYSLPRPARRAFGREPKAVETALAYIHAHHASDISVRDLAAVSGLSPYHFIRVFNRQVGLTPHAYLTQVRVENARQLLHRGQTPVQTALATGFFDQSHLTRHFKRIVGTTPGRYRNSVQDHSAR
jgi:AraC-like DNA-binding protein